MALTFVMCSLSTRAAQSTLLLEGVRRRISQRRVAAAFGAAALALTFTSIDPDAAAQDLRIGGVATGVGEGSAGALLRIARASRGCALLGRQAAAGNLGQALGSVSAGSLFARHPMAPFWTSALVLVFGSTVVLT